MPYCMWFPGLFNPMAYLTAVMQITGRVRGFPLDKMTTETTISTLTDIEGPNSHPYDGQIPFDVGADLVIGNSGTTIVTKASLLSAILEASCPFVKDGVCKTCTDTTNSACWIDPDIFILVDI